MNWGEKMLKETILLIQKHVRKIMKLLVKKCQNKYSL